MAGLDELFKSISKRWSTNPGLEGGIHAPIFQNRHTRAYGFVRPQPSGIQATYIDNSRPETVLKASSTKGLERLVLDMERSPQAGVLFVDPSSQLDGNTLNHEAAHELFDRGGLDHDSPKISKIYSAIPQFVRNEYERGHYQGQSKHRIVDEAGAYGLGSPSPIDQLIVDDIANAMPNRSLESLYRKLDALERRRTTSH